MRRVEALPCTLVEPESESAAAATFTMITTGVEDRDALT